MQDGLLDVRTRDGKRHGKLRVDKVVEMMKEEQPENAKAFNDFYAKAFDPVKAFGLDAGATDGAAAASAEPAQVS